MARASSRSIAASSCALEAGPGDALHLHFMYNWNDFLWPLVITTTPEMRTLPAGLALFMGQHTVEHPLLMAGATLTLLPLLIGFLLAQRQFVRGVAMTGLK